MALHLSIYRHRSLTNPTLLHHFSTSSNDPNNPNDSYSPGNPPSVSSYLNNVNSNHHHQHREQQTPGNPTSKPMPVSGSIKEIRKNLSEFRHRPAVPPLVESSPKPSQSQSDISFLEIYRRSFLAKQGESNESPDGFAPGGKSKFDAVRDSLRKMRQDHRENNVDGKPGSFYSLAEYRDSLKMTASGDKMVSSVIGGSSSERPTSVSGRETKVTVKRVEAAMKMEFIRVRNYEDLGKKLKDLRPPVKEGGEGWFSLQELNERLTKLRILEEKEMENKSRTGGFPHLVIREAVQTFHKSQDYKQEKAIPTVEFLDVLGRTPEFMKHPPKEHLVEKYFHPDNMSSEEKLKIELAKVRDEFKMSESDCGSARVQVAQLTTKIKHLSSVLHKKDKHSKKGLLAMVQKRKKLLKYLRRTDWDSYCLVLSKLGLRDTAESKS